MPSLRLPLRLLTPYQLNSYALNSVGPELELIGGPRRFLSVYLVSAVTATLASFVFTPSPSLGSSGEGQRQRP